MKSYVVRVYRYSRKDPRRIVGVVEEIGEKAKNAFTNIEELWEILNPHKRETGFRKKTIKTKREVTRRN